MYAMSALIPTPKNPEIAGWADSRRISRHTKISAATPSAAPIAGSSPKGGGYRNEHHDGQRGVDQPADAAHLIEDGVGFGGLPRFGSGVTHF